MKTTIATTACIAFLFAAVDAQAKGQCKGKAKERPECKEVITPPDDEPDTGDDQPDPTPPTVVVKPKKPDVKPKKPEPKVSKPKRPSVVSDREPQGKRKPTHVTVTVMRPKAVWAPKKFGIFGGGWSRSLRCTSPVGEFETKAAQVADCEKRAGVAK